MAAAAEPGLREQLVSDLPPALALLGSLQEQGLLQRVRAGAFPTEKGLSFLELKAQLLLLYLQGLAQLVLEKSWGRSLAAQPAVLRLAELRTVLEKMRPIEQKLRYQVDKLVKVAVMGALSDEEEADGTEGKAAGKKPLAKGGVRKYVPPRLVPVHYGSEPPAEEEEDECEEGKEEG
ncbi:peroxisomal leader peptide-processing protease [Platysternon megacephalum]|uniref:Peroxisomal leader peptide-processing protease n=1 Tax=Platysternon megacephalum TaxID=55544 RepID=A0A4D9DQF8_9SAUR|nr:peroxisomal leader peptide-processing protease [Platysternon megacephalum]